jgi:hypothetical protein
MREGQSNKKAEESANTPDPDSPVYQVKDNSAKPPEAGTESAKLKNSRTSSVAGKAPPPQSAPPSQVPDPFNPASLRLSQDFEAGLGVKKVLTTVPVRKPTKESFIQVHPGDDFQIQTCVIELKDEREVFLVAKSLWHALAGEATFGPRALFTTITRQGVVIIWPIRLPDPNGKIDSWNESALAAANRAQGRWVRVAANMGLGGYDVFEATGSLPPPSWPDVSFHDLLRIAFKDRYIDSMDHLVLRKLRGEA